MKDSLKTINYTLCRNILRLFPQSKYLKSFDSSKPECLWLFGACVSSCRPPSGCCCGRSATSWAIVLLVYLVDFSTEIKFKIHSLLSIQGECIHLSYLSLKLLHYNHCFNKEAFRFQRVGHSLYAN